MRRPPHRRAGKSKVDFRPLLEVAEPRILLSITSRAPAAIVNSTTTGNQNSPAVAMDANGDSIVVWKDASKENSTGGYLSDIRAQRYNPTGSKVQKNGSTAGAQEFIVHSEADATFIERQGPAVAMDPAGDFVVAWIRNDTTVTGNYLYEVQARVFNASGTALTSDINVSANNHTIRSQPAVAMDSSGNWVITWTDAGGTGNDIFAKKYNLNGGQQTLNGSTNALLVNAGATTGNQFQSTVGADSSGDFVVGWTSFNSADGNGQEVFAQRFNASGVSQGGTLHVNQTTAQNQGQAQLAVTPSGDFIVAWVNDPNDGSANRGDVYARYFNANGTARTNEFQVNANGLGFQTTPDVAVDSNGNATVVWGNIPNSNGSNPGVFARRVNAQGVPIEASDIRVATLTGTDQDSPSVAVDPQGDVAFAYRQINGTGPSTDTDIYAHFYAYVNDAPTINALSDLTIPQDAPLQTVNLSGIAAGGGESQVLTVTASSNNSALIPNPSVVYTSANNTGSITFTPAAGQFGTATITITVTDNGGTANGGVNTISRQFTVTVAGKPTANNQSVNVAHNTAQPITLTGTDPNSPPRSLTYIVTANPSHGTLSGTAPNLSYTPSAGYQGSDSFQFKTNNGVLDSGIATVSITVAPGTPTANNQSVNVAHNTAKAITLTASDPDSPTLPLTYSLGASPAHGTLSGFNATTGAVTYTPNAGYHGSDSFQFTANNGTNTSAAATVSLTVAVGTPTANSQSVSTNQDTAVAITLTGSDDDVPALTLTFAIIPGQGPSHGTLSGTAPNLTYTPSAGYTGPDSFQFKVNNGTNDSVAATVSISVAATNHAPTANSQSVTVPQDTATTVTLTASDPDQGDTLTYTVTQGPSHGTLSGTAPNLTYTPSAGYFGADSFQFKATDNHGADSNVATVSINVVGKPTANGQTVSTNQDTAVAVTLTGTDPNSPPRSLTYIVTQGPSHGALSGTAPNLTYTPSAGYAGPDSFQFKVNNGELDSGTATVSISVAAVAATVSSTTVGWGSQTSGNLVTQADGLRLLPSGRSMDMPWLNVGTITITLDRAAALSASDVSATGVKVANYGPVTITPASGSNTSYTITLAKLVASADRVTLTIGNASIATFTRRIDVLPGDVNDDGVVNISDAVIVRNMYLGGTYTIPLIFGDINGDGVVDVNDYNAVRRNNGTKLP